MDNLKGNWRHCEPNPERSEGVGEAIQDVGFTTIPGLLPPRAARGRNDGIV